MDHEPEETGEENHHSETLGGFCNHQTVTGRQRGFAPILSGKVRFSKQKVPFSKQKGRFSQQKMGFSNQKKTYIYIYSQSTVKMEIGTQFLSAGLLGFILTLCMKYIQGRSDPRGPLCSLTAASTQRGEARRKTQEKIKSMLNLSAKQTSNKGAENLFLGKLMTCLSALAPRKRAVSTCQRYLLLKSTLLNFHITGPGQLLRPSMMMTIVPQLGSFLTKFPLNMVNQINHELFLDFVLFGSLYKSNSFYGYSYLAIW